MADDDKIVCTCERCINEYRIKSIESQIEENKASHEKFYDKLENLGREQVKTETTYATILEKIGSLETKVDALASKPTKRWESVVGAVIAAVVAAAVAYFVGGA